MKVREDRLQWFSIITSVILTFLHAYQYYDSDWMWIPGVKTIYCLVYPLFIITLHRKGMWIWFLLFGSFLSLTGVFNNYTAFIIFTLLYLTYKPSGLWLLILYGIETVTVCTLHDKSIVHFVIHAINCGCIFFAIRFSFECKFNSNKLKLTPDEIFILKKLQEGYEQKEIMEFHYNTVSKKLRQAKYRNSIATTEELLLKFINEFK